MDKRYDWEKLKRRLADKAVPEFVAQFDTPCYALLKSIEDDFRTDWRSNTVEFTEAVRKRVMAWDVRCAGRLIKLFEKHVPSALRGKQIGAEYDDEDRWVVYPLEEEQWG